MLRDKEWEEIRYSLVEGGYFDFEVRPKTLNAIRRVVERMSIDELDTLQERTSIIFAPAVGKHGEVYPFAPVHLVNGEQTHTVMVYLSPEVERRSKEYVQSVVAHEFAHVLLHPFDSSASPSIERQADEKIREWRFKPAYHDGNYPEQS